MRPGGWWNAKLSHIILYSFCVVTHSSNLTVPACSASPVSKGRGDFPTHLSLSHLHLLPIKYDRSLARSRIDLVEAITRYTNKPINYPFRMRPAYFTSPLQGTTWGPSATPSDRHKTSLVHRSSLSCIAVNAPTRHRWFGGWW